MEVSLTVKRQTLVKYHECRLGHSEWRGGDSEPERNLSMDAMTLADRYWDELLELNPLLATQVGDDRFDERLPDPSPAGADRRRSVHRTALETAAALRPTVTDWLEIAVCDTVNAIAAPQVATVELGMHRFEPIDQLWGPGTLLDRTLRAALSAPPGRTETPASNGPP